MPTRILSGTRPTSKLHLGNLLGALDNWKKYQSEDSFYMIADYHVLTTDYASHVDITENVIEVTLDYLSCGLDPDVCTIFVQSHVHEHAELALLLSMITPLGWLERNPTYKDQMRELKGRDLHTHGFLGYPVLQASDILLYQADMVPVGEDQIPHIELTREIARRFNHLYGETFKEPQAALTQTKKLPGTDGRKMSKSYENCIYISDDSETVTKKVMGMITDPARKRRTDKGHPEVCPVCYYHETFGTPEIEQIKADCCNAGIGCVDCKKMCSQTLNSLLDPIRQKRSGFAPDLKKVNDILITGSQKAQKIASQTFKNARTAVGF